METTESNICSQRFASSRKRDPQLASKVRANSRFSSSFLILALASFASFSLALDTYSNTTVFMIWYHNRYLVRDRGKRKIIIIIAMLNVVNSIKVGTRLLAARLETN